MNKLQPAWVGISRLQNKFNTAIPLSFDSKVYDKAIDIALSNLTTSDSKYLVHNSYRHAKTHIVRTNRTSPQLDSLDESIAEIAAEYQLEESINNSQLVTQLIELAKAQSGTIYACVQQWLLGCSLEETSQNLNLSFDAIKKIRQRFKKDAQVIVGAS